MGTRDNENKYCIPCSQGGVATIYIQDDLRAFGINADQWTTAAQDEGE